MNPLDDPITEAERLEQQRLVQEALAPIIGGPRSLRFPASRVLQALCRVAGIHAALTLRRVEDVRPLIEDGQRAAEKIEGRPVPVRFVADAGGRQVAGLVKQITFTIAGHSLRQRTGTAEAVAALAHLAGQVSTLVLIAPEQLMALVQAGIDQGRPEAGRAQASIAQYYNAKATLKGKRS